MMKPPLTLLAWLRTRRGLTQRTLAFAAGLNQETVSQIESGTAQPRTETLQRLYEALGVEPDVMTGRQLSDPSPLATTGAWSDRASLLAALVLTVTADEVGYGNSPLARALQRSTTADRTVLTNLVVSMRTGALAIRAGNVTGAFQLATQALIAFSPDTAAALSRDLVERFAGLSYGDEKWSWWMTSLPDTALTNLGETWASLIRSEALAIIAAFTEALPIGIPV